jgi:hypothetical protein
METAPPPAAIPAASSASPPVSPGRLVWQRLKKRRVVLAGDVALVEDHLGALRLERADHIAAGGSVATNGHEHGAFPGHRV